ncbi:MAG TPA: acyltransferase domain-containing protein, partial [Kofleriaceae bacterium]
GGFAYTATSGRARHGVRARVAAADKLAALAALDAIASNAPSPAVTLGAGHEHHDVPLEELPRRVVVLPHYPWEREHYAPEAPAMEPAPVSVTAAQASSAPLHEPSRPSPVASTPPSALTVRDQVRRCVATLLGHRDASAVLEDASFFDLGLDSLMAADLARELSLAFGLDLSIAHVFEHPTVNDLAAAVVAQRPDPASEIARPAVPEAAVSRAPRDSAGTARAPRIAFLFSGGGSQYFGMGRELYDAEPVFRARIDACDRILAPLLGASLTDLMMHGDDRQAIDQMRVMQPALVALELALADLWSSWGVTASAVIGHSLGEIAAAIHAGVMDLDSGLALVAHRARLMQEAAPGAMLAVNAPLPRVARWLEATDLDIAAINGPQAVVVAGAHDAVEALTAQLLAEGVTARRLAVSHASHSRLMDPILPALNDAIASFPFRAPSLPIIANLTGRLAAAGEYDARYWCRHVREPVRFHDGAQALRALDIDVCLEIGPDRTLVNLVAAAGLLPAGGGLASLRRGAGDRASILAAAQALHDQGQELAWRELQAASNPARRAAVVDADPREDRSREAPRRRPLHAVRNRPGDRCRPVARRHLHLPREHAGRAGERGVR